MGTTGLRRVSASVSAKGASFSIPVHPRAPGLSWAVPLRGLPDREHEAINIRSGVRPQHGIYPRTRLLLVDAEAGRTRAPSPRSARSVCIATSMSSRASITYGSQKRFAQTRDTVAPFVGATFSTANQATTTDLPVARGRRPRCFNSTGPASLDSRLSNRV